MDNPNSSRGGSARHRASPGGLQGDHVCLAVHAGSGAGGASGHGGAGLDPAAEGAGGRGTAGHHHGHIAAEELETIDEKGVCLDIQYSVGLCRTGGLSSCVQELVNLLVVGSYSSLLFVRREASGR